MLPRNEQMIPEIEIENEENQGANHAPREERRNRELPQIAGAEVTLFTYATRTTVKENLQLIKFYALILGAFELLLQPKNLYVANAVIPIFMLLDIIVCNRLNTPAPNHARQR